MGILRGRVGIRFADMSCYCLLGSHIGWADVGLVGGSEGLCIDVGDGEGGGRIN